MQVYSITFIHILIVVTMYYFPAKLSVSETHSPSSSVTIEKNNMKGMYMLYDGGAWSTGCTRVASFDRTRARSASGLSKLKPRVCNPVDHKQSHRITYLYDDIRDRL